MAMPRSKYVREGQEGVYHCFSRCVRRAFLCGFDPLTRRDFSHRKAWILSRLKHLSAIFAIEVCAYAILHNHYHLILRIRPDLAAGWSDREVATRWLRLFPKNHPSGNTPSPPTEDDIAALVQWPERIAVLRKRLSSLSWFMGRLNEYIARAANKEDDVKGRFWESRFKCQALLDAAAIASCMVYVDLNLIRVGLAATPEESDFTSIQERIRSWQKDSILPPSVSGNSGQNIHCESLQEETCIPDKNRELPDSGFVSVSAKHNSLDASFLPACWLCPISSELHLRGILPMTAAEYFDLVDRSGRMIRSDKRGAIDANLAPILLRIGANPEAWAETISGFGYKFSLVAGMLSSLRHLADQFGKRWFKGVAAARAAFVPKSPQLA